MIIKSSLATFFALIWWVNVLHAQNMAIDTPNYTGAAAYAVDLYNHTISTQSEFYNGPSYQLHITTTYGSPYFQDLNYFTPGLIKYNGIWYKNIPLIYDVFKDVVVTSLPDSYSKNIIRPDKLSDFYFNNHHFVHLYNLAPDAKPTDGFYDLLYNGKTQVLVKRKKQYSEVTAGRQVETTYTDKTAIYIKKGNTYYNVSSKGSVLDVFKDKKKELNQYLSANHIKYNENKELSVTQLATYYDQITD